MDFVHRFQPPGVETASPEATPPQPWVVAVPTGETCSGRRTWMPSHRPGSSAGRSFRSSAIMTWTCVPGSPRGHLDPGRPPASVLHWSPATACGWLLSTSRAR